LLDEGEIDAHPMLKLSPPEPKAKPVPVLTDEELTGLLKACGGKEFHDRRDEAMMRLLGPPKQPSDACSRRSPTFTGSRTPLLTG
jgi:hypothetical protein